jgi:hypothetical protein
MNPLFLLELEVLLRYLHYVLYVCSIKMAVQYDGGQVPNQFRQRRTHHSFRGTHFIFETGYGGFLPVSLLNIPTNLSVLPRMAPSIPRMVPSITLRPNCSHEWLLPNPALSVLRISNGLPMDFHVFVRAIAVEVSIRHTTTTTITTTTTSRCLPVLPT